VLDDGAERLTAGRAERLEARELRLDRQARVRRRVDQRAAVGEDSGSRRCGGIGRIGPGGGGRERPERRGIGIEAEDEL
jgi:hypothetical protein